MSFPVDVLTILGPGRQIQSTVLSALEYQGSNIEIRHYIHCGGRRSNESRLDAIVRSRNEAKKIGIASFVMLLDDDIIIPHLSIEKLIYALIFNPYYAAIGINAQRPLSPSPLKNHIGMGAIMFYRNILEKIIFRYSSCLHKCECSCCCEDIRAMGYLVDYLPFIKATHNKL